ncbi:hypothetical protein OHA53_33470 [Streptomyces althioticus]|uniref:hypothetical protein n=1 Tax=Streptomyces althioticus TaxID=83380 RepID=UPI0038737F77|nr:hypothetical protein OHA53_33470 [Streptomyces althioticus]
MTTFSSSSSNEPGIPVDTAAAPPVGTTGAATGAHRPEPAWARHGVPDHTAPADARYVAGAGVGTAPPRDPSGPDRTARQDDTGHPRDPVPGNHPRDPVDRPREPAGAEAPRDPVATVDLVDPVDTTRELGAPRRLGDTPEPAGPPGAAPGATGRVYADPVTDLVHAAVSDRPLEEVVDLITALERSPEHTRAVVDALRAAGVDRSVEDVTRLVALLTRPPRDAASADETIRAAAAHRSVEDVTLLVALLHNEPLAPHCREEALRAAATGRSVDELVELIDRLAAQRPPEHLLRAAVAEASRPAQEAEGQGEVRRNPRPEPERAPASRGGALRTGRRRSAARRTPRPARRPRPAAARTRAARPVPRSAIWTSWLAAVALAVCAVTHFPLQRDGVSLNVHALAVGMSVLCTVLALIPVVRPAVVVLGAGVVAATVLAVAHAYGGSFTEATLPRAVDLALAPDWLATSAAVAAALLALAALVVRVAAPPPGTRWSPWPPAEPHHATD